MPPTSPAGPQRALTRAYVYPNPVPLPNPVSSFGTRSALANLNLTECDPKNEKNSRGTLTETHVECSRSLTHARAAHMQQGSPAGGWADASGWAELPPAPSVSATPASPSPPALPSSSSDPLPDRSSRSSATSSPPADATRLCVVVVGKTGAWGRQFIE